MQVSREQELQQIIQTTPWFMSALGATRELNLTSWCIGAGAIRNLVWDRLCNLARPSPLNDVDVAFFDLSDLSPERDRALQQQLQTRLPGVPWEVTNQAGVHLWFESVFEHKAGPLLSLAEAVATWPETATCVGVSLDANDRLHILAPLGLEDLFNVVVKRNPNRVSLQTYRRRIVEKNYAARWPQVIVIP